MVEICEKKRCTGCSSCYNICPQNAIEMVQDSCGFLYPSIEQNKCINCGLCLKHCPVLNPVRQQFPLSCFAVAVRDDNELFKSASGGAASQVAKKITENNGVVYGCCGEDPRNVKHIRVADTADIKLLQGSKYVQSEIGGVFKGIREDLKQGKVVFFVGTPCQVAGLKRFVGTSASDRLYTADLVCHGVPSQKMLNDNIETYVTNKDEKVSLSFRKKSLLRTNSVKHAKYNILFGWFLQSRQNNTIEKAYEKDAYMEAFMYCLTFRDSCYTCCYATSGRCGDITLADFWGLGNDAGFDNGKGVSLVLVNTDKGKRLLSLVEKDCCIVERNITEAIIGNGQLQRPSVRPREIDKFRILYSHESFKVAVDKSLRRKRLIRIIKSMKAALRKIISKIL